MSRRLSILSASLFLVLSSGLMALSPAEQFGYRGHVIAKADSPSQEKKAQPGFGKDGFYVVMGNYFPKIPTDLPAETKPAVWLSEQDPGDLEWEKSPQPVYFYIPNTWAKRADMGENEWTVGRSVTLPITFSFTPPPQDGEESVSIGSDGALLLKVEGNYPNAPALVKAHPAVEEAGVTDSVIKIDDKGTFSFEYAEDGQGEIELHSQPMELAPPGEEWPVDDQQTAIDMYYFFHENFGCFVATAIYRRPAAPQLTSLRAFRDKILLTSVSGRRLMSYYYRNGPSWAWNVYQKPVRAKVVKPFVATAAFAVSHLDLEGPKTQKVLHKLVDAFAWVVTPWITPEEEATSS